MATMKTWSEFDQNQWLTVKMKLYKKNVKQYSSKADVWKAIKPIMSEIKSAKVKEKYNKING